MDISDQGLVGRGEFEYIRIESEKIVQIDSEIKKVIPLTSKCVASFFYAKSKTANKK